MHRQLRMLIIRLLLLLLPALVLFPLSETKADTAFQVNYGPVKETVSALIRDEMKKNDVTGLSIALVDDQRIVWTQGFGYADEERNVAVTPETVFRIGTLTKVFTAFAAMQLVEQGKLKLDAPVRTYLPQFSIRTRFSGENEIRIRHLLTHHSGLPVDYLKGMWTRRPQSYTTVIDLIKNEYAAYPPGFIYSYSNVGYDVVAGAMASVTREDYARRIQNNILNPLNMTRSGFTPPAPWQMSKAYFKGIEGEDPPLRDIPSGGMYSTAVDIAYFMKMIFANGGVTGRVLMQPKTLAEMFRPQNGNVPLDLGLRTGLGWLLGDLGDVDIHNAGPVAHHAGATLAFRSQIVVVPRHKLGVIVLANSSSAGRTVAKVAALTLKSALEIKAGIRQPFVQRSPQVDIILPETVRSQYRGQYASMVGLADITPKSDRFLLEVAGRTLTLVPQANGSFGLKYVFLGLFPISLAALDEYEISHATVAGHQILRAKTKGSELLAAEKIQAASVPRAWQQRVGRYTIENLGGDIPVFEKIALRYEDGWMLLECSMPYFLKTPVRFPLKIVSDTEATIAGLGRGMGETLRVVRIDGKEKLGYSGYVLSRTE